MVQGNVSDNGSSIKLMSLHFLKIRSWLATGTHRAFTFEMLFKIWKVVIATQFFFCAHLRRNDAVLDWKFYFGTALFRRNMIWARKILCGAITDSTVFNTPPKKNLSIEM